MTDTDPGHPFDRLTPAPSPSESFLADGHVWRFEHPPGTPVRARLRPDGRLELGVPADPGWPALARGVDRWRRLAVDDAPPTLGFVARALRRGFDRDTLRAATDDASQVAFECVAVHRRREDVDPDGAPAVVAVDAAAPGTDWLPHELRRLFEAVGLPAAPTLESETPVARLDPTATPDSRLSDAPAFGVGYHKKPSGAAVRSCGPATLDRPSTPPTDAERVAADWVTDDRLDRLVAVTDGDPTVDRLGTASFDRLVRAQFPTVVAAGFDAETLRDAVVARIARQWESG
ncbi:hypothetical protein [Halobaculum sp. MBLA0143]|uniref:hypothetical protein n=1 Tax=Halobaculum sp. MBLA0143 TaxID=3079933 RepID=UPI0035260EAD